MNNLDLVFSLFNINVFQQAKNNITDIQYYFDTNASTSGNKLIGELISAIKTYNFDQIDLPLFNSILTRCGKTPAESSKIVSELIKWKSYNKKQMEPAKRFLDDIVANSIIQRANRLYDEHPADFLKYLKNAEFKTSTLDTLSSTAFGQIDINSVMENEMSDGVSSSFDFINQSFKPDCKIPMGQMGIICMPPGCFVGDTEIYTPNGIETLKELCGRTNIEVYSFNGKEKIKSIAEKCIKTKEVSKLIKISTSDGGIIKSYGNTFNGKYTYVPYQEDNTQFDAYEASTRNEQVPSSVKTLEGGTSYNNFDTDSKVFYVDGYTPDAAADVPTVVTGYYGAGRLNHGDFTWTFNNSVDDEDYGVNTELKNKILSYETSLVKIYGDENAESGEQGGEGGDEGGTTEPGGGDEGGETGDGGDTPVIEGAITCSFGDNTWTNSDFFDITGNTSNSKGSVTINGTEYTYCLKMESSTSIKFTIDKPMTLNLYFGTNSENKNYDIKIDDVKYEANATTRILTVQLEAGSHELAKASTSNLFYIELIPVAE